MSKSRTTQSCLIVLLTAITISTITLFFSLGIHINLSESMPIGLYREVSHPLIVGDIVSVCLPEEIAREGMMRGYIGVGRCANNSQPLVKQVIAMGGDVVRITPNQIFINGKLIPQSKTQILDESGRTLPAISRGTYQLQESQVWLQGIGHQNSWDSRYYGPIEKEQITSIVKPFITWSRVKHV